MLFFAFFADLGIMERPIRSTSKVLIQYRDNYFILPRLSAHISHRGQILGRHTFPNWFRIVSHTSRRRNTSPATLPLSIEVPRVMECSDNSAESLGMPIFRFDLTIKCSHSASLALSNAGASGSGSSRTNFGGHEVSIPAQPSAHGPLEAPALTPRPNEGSEQTSAFRAPPVPVHEHRNEDLPVLRRVNPRRGPTSGGDEVDLIVSNLPPMIQLYARFGSNIASTVSSIILRVPMTIDSLS